MSLTNLNRRLSSMDRRSIYYQRKNHQKFWPRLIVSLIVLVVLIYFPARGIYSAARDLSTTSKKLSEDFKNENLDAIRADIKSMKDSSASLNRSTNFLFWMQVIPFFGGYYLDLQHFSYALTQDLEAMQVLTDSLEPYKAELGFVGVPTPGQDKVAQLVKILDKVLPNIDKVEPQLKNAADSVSSVDTGKYPEKFGSHNIRPLIEAAKNFIIGANLATTQYKSALVAAPSALGDPTPKTYLILFQNDKELRATGGFLTAYAFLKLDHGHVSTSGSDDIYTLDTKLLNVCLHVICPLTPPTPIVRYLPEANGQPRTAWSMRDSNLSPDLPISMQEFEKMYSFLDEQKFDGIITIDTEVVREMISVTGPVDVFGTTYSADLDKRCNCSNVVYELENYSEKVAQGQSDRKAILGQLMQEILAKALNSSTQNLPQFINVGAELASGKHMMFYFHDSTTQQAFDQLNWTGRILQSRGDYLHINDSNFAGGKSNLYVTEDVSLTIDGSGKHTLTINYSNPQEYNSWLNAINRDYFRVYVPAGSKLISNKGYSDAGSGATELGKTYFDGFIQVRPQNSLSVQIQYTTPQSYDSILIQKQPGSKDFTYHLNNNGKSQTFTLSTDKNIKL